MRTFARTSTLLLTLVAAPAVLTGLLAGPVAAATGLTPVQERTVLRLVDDICGDTWCEGDHLFRFRSFTCAPAYDSCLLRLRIAPLVEPGVAPSWRWRSGRIHGFVRFREMVATAPGGQCSLKPAFHAAVDDLVTRLESTVP